jgi:hypothetical protein
MQSPSAEWLLAIGYLGMLDYLRSRGEADFDTLSEVTRAAVYRHRHGKAAFTVGLAVGAVALHRHIVRE